MFKKKTKWKRAKRQILPRKTKHRERKPKRYQCRKKSSDKTGQKVSQQDSEDGWWRARSAQSIYRVRWPSSESSEGDNVPKNFNLSPVDSPKSNAWYKMIPIVRNTLAKQMQSIASIASLDGKFSNSSGRKTIIQALRYDFDPLEISKLTGHANPESISSYSHNPLEKQRQRQLPMAIQVMFYGRLFSTAQPAKQCSSYE